jgi:F-type H+-transporting ATPase subunit c
MTELTGCILAAGEPGANNLAVLGTILGVGLAIVGAATGIGFIGAKASEAIARQPQIGGRILTAMIIAAALIEGLTFFALIIGFLAIFWMLGR